jgi:hypothetical protein
MTSKVARPLKRRWCSIYGPLEDKTGKKDAHRDIRGHSRGFSKPSSSDPPQIAQPSHYKMLTMKYKSYLKSLDGWIDYARW